MIKYPWITLVACLAGMLDKQTQFAIEYLREENKILREKLGTKRIILTISKAAGTSLMVVWFTTLVGVVGHVKNGNINYYLLASMLTCGFIGTHYGTVIGLKMHDHKLHFYFSFVMLAAVLLFTKVWMLERYRLKNVPIFIINKARWAGL